MKKLFTFFALVTTFLVLFNTTEAGDRMMLIEFFTSSTCGPCASNNPIMTAFMNSADPERIASLGFHMNWPSPGNDPMYLFNTTDNTTRRTFYGVNAIPAGFFDGTISIPLPYSQTNLQSYFDSRKNVLSPVTIIVRDSTYGDSMLVRVNVQCETFLANPNVVLYMGIFESTIHYVSPPGTNGETDFQNVMRRMLPSANGTPLVLTPGYNKEFVFRYKMDPAWVAGNIKNLVYIQGADKEILNASKKLVNFSLMTTSSFFSITQGQAATKNFKVKIPYAATGYNSPVTFTSEVQPVTSGLSAAFPSGSVLSNFPDSLSVQVSSTAAVPAGTYKIILTGTSASGKVHKISVDYLVGKNYVTVQTSNNQLSFNVDNTQYVGASLFNWDINSSHTIQAISPQTSGSTRYVFSNWSNSGDTTQSISINSNTSVYTANYKTQFKILTLMSPSGMPITINNGNQFFDSSSSVNVSVSPLTVSYNGKTYYFSRWLGAGAGSYTGNNSSFQVTLTNPINQIVYYDTINTGISKLGSEIPSKYDLHQNYPNPFNPTTNIKFDIIRNEAVKLEVYDITGRVINTLVNGKLEAGKYSYTLDASSLPSGVYFYKLATDNYTMTRRMILLK